MGISERAGKVVQQICIAFADTRYPGDRNLVYDNSDYHLACKAVRGRFLEKTWKGVDTTLMKAAWGGDLSFLSPEAFRYFLPGFMIATLTTANREQRCDETLLFHIAPRETDDTQLIRGDFARIDGFTLEQRDAIRAFLHVFRDEYADLPDPDVDLAIRFWESIE